MTKNTDPARDWSAVAAAWDASVDEVDSHSIEATAGLLDRVGVQPGERVWSWRRGPAPSAPPGLSWSDRRAASS